jgi:Domain of unknown function (DUF4386)
VRRFIVMVNLPKPGWPPLSAMPTVRTSDGRSGEFGTSALPLAYHPYNAPGGPRDGSYQAGATATNLLAHEMLLRTSVVIWLLGMALWIVMALALYRLFNAVSKALASLLVIFVAVSAGIGFLNELNNLAPILVLRSNEFAGTLTQPQREAVAMLFLRLHGQGHAVNEMFWGLWLLPFGLLIARSHFIPRLLGIWLLLDGFAWIGLSMVALLTPATTMSRLKRRSQPCSQSWR